MNWNYTYIKHFDQTFLLVVIKQIKCWCKIDISYRLFFLPLVVVLSITQSLFGLSIVYSIDDLWPVSNRILWNFLHMFFSICSDVELTKDFLPSCKWQEYFSSKERKKTWCSRRTWKYWLGHFLSTSVLLVRWQTFLVSFFFSVWIYINRLSVVVSDIFGRLFLTRFKRNCHIWKCQW